MSHVKRSITTYSGSGKVVKEVLIPTKPDEQVAQLLKWMEDVDVVIDSAQVGSTGYLDCFQPKDFKGPLAKGKDLHGRPFLCIKMKCIECTDKEDKKFAKAIEGKLVVETLFQRYVEGGPVTSGGSSSLIYSTLDKDAIKRVETILSGGRIESRFEYAILELAK